MILLFTDVFSSSQLMRGGALLIPFRQVSVDHYLRHKAGYYVISNILQLIIQNNRIK